MSRIYCVDCGIPVVLDPSGRCPEGHHVELGGQPAAPDDPTTELAEPTGRLADVDLDALAADAARTEASAGPPAAGAAGTHTATGTSSWADEAGDDDEPEPWVAPAAPAADPGEPPTAEGAGADADDAEAAASSPGDATGRTTGDEADGTHAPVALDADFLAQLEGLDGGADPRADRQDRDHPDDVPQAADHAPAPDHATATPDGAPAEDADAGPPGSFEAAFGGHTAALFDAPAPGAPAEARTDGSGATTGEIPTTRIVSTAPGSTTSTIDPTNFTASGAQVVAGGARRGGLRARIGGRRVS